MSTSSSETALPRLIAKMEHLGVSRSTVGIVVPTGYSFNLDGTAIYLTMASLFIAEATGNPLSIGEQISLLVFMIIASKGAAGVTGAGLATLAGGLQSHRPDLVDGVGIIVGIDRFMSEARAVTNFAGNAVATVLIGTWTRTIDTDRVREVLAGARAVRRERHARRALPRPARRCGRRRRGPGRARRRRGGRRPGGHGQQGLTGAGRARPPGGPVAADLAWRGPLPRPRPSKEPHHVRTRRSHRHLARDARPDRHRGLHPQLGARQGRGRRPDRAGPARDGVRRLPVPRRPRRQGFVGTLSKGEIALGALLLTPLVPTVVAGAALTGFSAALLGMYLRTPGLTRDDGVRPTPDGIGIAKDVFMLGIGVSMLVDGLGRLRSRRG